MRPGGKTTDILFDYLEYLHGHLFIFQLHFTDKLTAERLPDFLMRFPRDINLTFPGNALQAGCYIDRVSDDRVVKPFQGFATYISLHHVP